MKEHLKSIISRVISFLKAHKISITTSIVTSLVLDVVTGVIFGFGGTALYMAL
jgi:hypothetical protein